MEKHEASVIKTITVLITILIMFLIFRISLIDVKKLEIKGEVWKAMVEQKIVPQDMQF
ncbi:hypothetical protein KAR91_34635 [Candidatus Pacearchaeota archaeon]|nr:hypothetical protein [Candidatus Pacearchaeota archaeon]